jgi:hypothetical protein
MAETKWWPIYHTFSKKMTLFGQKQLGLEDSVQESSYIRSVSWQKYQENHQLHLLLDKETWKMQKWLVGFKGLNVNIKIIFDHQIKYLKLNQIRKKQNNKGYP